MVEKEMATHSSILVWRIPGTGEPGGLPSMRLNRIGHDWSDLAAAAAAILLWREIHCLSSWKNLFISIKRLQIQTPWIHDHRSKISNSHSQHGTPLEHTCSHPVTISKTPGIFNTVERKVAKQSKCQSSDEWKTKCGTAIQWNISAIKRNNTLIHTKKRWSLKKLC